MSATLPYASLVAALAVLALPVASARGAAAPAWEFHAMDTAFQRAPLTAAEQFDLVKELGYAGVAWHQQPAAQLRGVLDELRKRQLRMAAIYCAAKVTPEGGISWSDDLPALFEVLADHKTIIWLHIGGRGPAFANLSADTPAVAELRKLADKAAQAGLKIAIYPHVGEWTARFADAVTLAEAVNHPAFGVSFNLCHALAMGEEKNIPDLLQRASPRLFIVTINGADSGVTGGNWARLIQTLDKGTYDVSLVLKKLAEIGFAGPVAFQGYGIKGDARSILAPTMQAWKDLVSRMSR